MTEQKTSECADWMYEGGCLVQTDKWTLDLTKYDNFVKII